MMGIDQGEMAQALNLTRAGRLAEATELIQRTLRSASIRSPRPPDSEIPRQNLAVLPGQAQPSDSLGKGVLLDGRYASGSGAMRYKIYIPADCPDQGAPLIIMLHGGTQQVLDYAAGTGMNPLADSHHFLVVYPEQDARANPMRYWNWFRPEDQQTGKGEPDLIAGITEQVISDYHADPDRVFIVGFSAGGAMAVVMAATYPHLYAAGAVHSGLPYGAAHDVPSAFALMRGERLPSRNDAALSIPLIVFHGDHDEIVNVVNASHIRRQRLGVNEALIAADGLQVTHGQVPGGRAYTRTTYSDETHVLLEQWIVHGAGHAWFGGTAGRSYTDPVGPDSSAEIVRFFLMDRSRNGVHRSSVG